MHGLRPHLAGEREHARPAVLREELGDDVGAEEVNIVLFGLVALGADEDDAVVLLVADEAFIDEARNDLTRE